MARRRPVRACAALALGGALLAIAATACLELLTGRAPVSVEWAVVAAIVIAVGAVAALLRTDAGDDE
jgi:hypothetical protein